MEKPAETFESAKRAISEGENFLAYDLAEKIPDENGHPPPQKLWVMALALARSGSLRRAKELAEQLPDSDNVDIAGLKSRIYKDLAVAEPDPERKLALFMEAAKRSLEIFRRKHAWYNGVNAASCLRMADRAEEALRLVKDEVLSLCAAETQKDMWLEATLGECHLLLSDFDRAALHYSRAAALALKTGSFGDLGSTLRQLKMLSASFADGAATLWSRIELPSVCVFSGHRIDTADRRSPRFPAALEPVVRAEIDNAVKRHRIALGYASCADGGDILFLESVLSAGGSVRVVPPFPLETSIRQSISATSGEWEKRLRKILANPRAKVVEPECDVTGECDAIAYDFTNRYMLGLTKLKSTMLNLPLCGLAVWDHVTAPCPGNTASAIRFWTETKLRYDIIKPEVRT